MKPTLFGWLASGEWRTYPLRMLLSVIAIATGVALGFAVHLINASALDQFQSAIRTVSGNADLSIVAVTPDGFDEALYPSVAQMSGVDAASPVVELDLPLAHSARPVKILGLDALRAELVNPALVASLSAAREPERVFDPDAAFVSGALFQDLGKKIGDSFEVMVNDVPVRLQIAGVLSGIPAGQRLVIMDIAGAQWHLGRLGRLSRVDIKLAPGNDVRNFAQELARRLPAGAHVQTRADEGARTGSLSRAYRVNLDMLALMALFTGGFLVYSIQSLSVTRRRAQIALLRVLGMHAREVIFQLVGEGAATGLVGSVLGLGLGTGLAFAALHWLGGDLGGGYFAQTRPALLIVPGAALAFFALGLAAAVAGSLWPALGAARAKPAAALKSSDGDIDPRISPRAAPAMILLILSAVFALLPPTFGLPVFGYISIACLLFGGIALMPRVARTVLGALGHTRAAWRALPLELAMRRLWGAPMQASVALCGIVSAMSLMVAMAVMVTSFRESVDAWIVQLLPADLYLHLRGPTADAGLDRVTRERLSAIPGIQKIEFLRFISLELDPRRPNVALIARHLDGVHPGRTLPLVRSIRTPNDCTPVWISEAMVDLYQLAPGQTLQLPLPVAAAAGIGRNSRVCIAGVWRDYARQYGAIVMREDDYARLTGDQLRTDAGIYLQPGARVGEIEDRIRTIVSEPLQGRLEFSRPAEIRATTLRIFDRSFAITYLLELAAILIGLCGVAATISAQTIARRHEFGMLRHVGVLRSQIMQMLGWEGTFLGILGGGAGGVLGLAMSQVLIHVINPQSFHWSMQTHVPWGILAVMGALLLICAAITACGAGKGALSGSVIRAVSEDW